MIPSMTFRAMLITVGLSLLALAGTNAQERTPTPADDPPLVEIGDQRFTLEEVVAYLRQGKPGLRFEQLPADEQERLLADFVDKKLLAHAARKQGLDRDPEIRARIDFFVERVLAQAFQRRIQEAIEVAPEEVETYYAEHRESFRTADRFHLEHLVYRRPESARWAREKLIDGAAYPALAEGDDPNLVFRERKWLGEELVLPELQPAVRALEPGGVSAIVETSYGYHVMRLVEVERGRVPDLDEVRDRVIGQIRQRETGERYRRLLAAARAERPVRIHLETLRADTSPAER